MLEGYIEALTPLQVSGWARNTNKPEERLRIQIDMEAVPVGMGAANLLRKDLLGAGIGDGRYGFSISMIPALPVHALDTDSLRIHASSLSGEMVRLRLTADARRTLNATALQVFIVGCPRSGTSILFHAMREVFKLPGSGESHVIPALQRMIHPMRLYLESFGGQANPEHLLITGLDRKRIEDVLFEYFRNFYVTAHNGKRWVDKTPSTEAVYGVALIEQVFPEARLIVTKRTGIEVVQSHILKFGGEFEVACTNWASSMVGIKKARNSCRSLLEVDQFDMTNDAGRIAAKIARHLGAEEKAAALAEFFVGKRIDQLSNHDWRKRLTLADVTWSPPKQKHFRGSAAR